MRKKVKYLMLFKQEIDDLFNIDAAMFDVDGQGILSTSQYFELESEYHKVCNELDRLASLGYPAKGYQDDQTLELFDDF